jgi:hypothetical protein
MDYSRFLSSRGACVQAQPRVRRIWSRWADVLVIVKPETVVGWHRTGFRLYCKVPVPRPSSTLQAQHAHARTVTKSPGDPKKSALRVGARVRASSSTCGPSRHGARAEPRQDFFALPFNSVCPLTPSGSWGTCPICRPSSCCVEPDIQVARGRCSVAGQ